MRRALRLATKETGMNKYFFVIGQTVKAMQMLVFPLLTLQANSPDLEGALQAAHHHLSSEGCHSLRCAHRILTSAVLGIHRGSERVPTACIHY